MIKNGIIYCRCGNLARPRQRNCAACNRASVRRSATKKKAAFNRLEQVLRNLTIENSATRREYESRFQTRAVITIAKDDEGVEIAGFVVGFLPDRMLKVLDDDGGSHLVSIDRVVEDCGRTIDGEMLRGE
jgi:hypothetical protein